MDVGPNHSFSPCCLQAARDESLHEKIDTVLKGQKTVLKGQKEQKNVSDTILKDQKEHKSVSDAILHVTRSTSKQV